MPAEKVIEKSVEIKQQENGTIEKTQTQKEISTPQGQPQQQQTHTVETPQPAAQRDYTFDPMTVLLWAGIAAAVIWLIFSHRRNR